MNDEILQHHFDEVFDALQDSDNFEIFTKMRPTTQPRIQRTFFKLVDPEEVKSDGSFCDKVPRKPISSSQNQFRPTPFNSRPSSANVTTVKAKSVFKAPSKPFSREAASSRVLSPPSTATSDASKFYSTRTSGNDLLGECKFCGRYFLGDYLTIHEEKCESPETTIKNQ